MTYLGIDTVHRFTAADAKNAVKNGISFVCRYLVPQGMGKDITAAEAKNKNQHKDGHSDRPYFLWV